MATHKRPHRPIKLTAAVTAIAAAAGVTLLNTSFAGAAPAEGTIYGADAEGAVAGRYIVLLDEKADKKKLAKEYGGTFQRNYSSAVYLAGHQDAAPADVATALTGGATADKITNPSAGTPNKLLKIVE